MVGVELGEFADLPPASPHDGFHHGRNLSQGVEGIFVAGKVFEVRVVADERVEFRHRETGGCHSALRGDGQVGTVGLVR